MLPISNYLTLWVIVFVSLAIKSSESAANLNNERFCKLDSLRLPQRIKPTHYELSLKLHHLEESAFEGQVKINVTIGKQDKNCLSKKSFLFFHNMKKVPMGCDNREIVLNANRRVFIEQVEFIVESENELDGFKSLKAQEICRDLESEFISIKLKENLRDNSHGQLVIKFMVGLGLDQYEEGLYRSTWQDKESFVTQFEAAHARKAFPCFDEPELKSTFDIIIEHAKDLTALSNTLPLVEEQVEGSTDLIRTRFERTPLMSTYLLAISVGRFEHLESKIMDEKLLLRVFVPPKQKEKGKWALDTARRAYSALHEYFEIEQPLKKIDLLPANTGNGDAMENWGLVTFRDDLLLVEPNTATLDLSRLAVTISHELVHHWFGNLVTMKWWDNLWLNEAFAEWMGYMIVDMIHPEFNVEFLFVQDLQMSGLEADARMDRSHPIKNPNLKTISDIEDSFDSITYAKGGAVLRMLEGFIGHEAFKLGIRDYIEKFKFKNTDEHDLWAALEARSDHSAGITAMMNTWLNQAGFPLVSVELIGDNNIKKLRVTQQRFQEKAAGHNEQLWTIPVNMVVVREDDNAMQKSQIIKFVLKENTQEISLPDWFDPSKGHWLKLNTDAEGFFRVSYDSQLLHLMEQPIRAKEMNVIDRMNLLDDMRALLLIKQVKYPIVKEILSWFELEDSPSVVYTLAEFAETLRSLSSGKTDKHLMLVDYYEKMGRYKCEPNEGIQEHKARVQVLLALIKGNYGPAIEEGQRLLASSGDEGFGESCGWPKIIDALDEQAFNNNRN